MTHDEQFSWLRGDGVLVIRAAGELDVHNADRLRVCCQEAIGTGGCRVVVDLADTTFMDSTALGVLVGLAKRTEATGGWLRLVTGNSAPVQTLLKLTALDAVLGDYPSVKHAIRDRVAAPLRH